MFRNILNKNPRAFRTILLAGFTLTAVGVGCTGLGDGSNFLQGIFGVVGTTPDGNFSENGRVTFALLTDSNASEQSTFASQSFQSSGAKVEVENDDGSYDDCEPVEETPHEGCKAASLTILIDDSGSMERNYPEEEYGDLCLSCPHDPTQERAIATDGLIDVIFSKTPESKITLLDFGPAPDEGRIATRVLHGFSDDIDSLKESLNKVDGSQVAGTPLWDALAESIGGLDEDADRHEDALLSRGIEKKDAKRYIVVLSDGADYDSVHYTLEQVIELALEHDVAIFAVGLGPAAALDSDNRYREEDRISAIQGLQQLARETGGFYASVTSPGALDKLFRDVAYVMTGGRLESTFECKPRDHQGTLQTRDVQSGEAVHGRITYGDGSQETWSVVAP